MDNRTPYKTADELGIEQWEHDGLVALVGPLSRGELNLDMREWHMCDTVHCIGGWVEVFAGRYFESEPRKGYYCLCYPAGNGRWDWEEIKASHAGRAVINFLVTGDPQWDHVMAED